MIALGLINIAMLYSVALKRWEAVAIAGLGLIYWIYALLRSHSIGAFVRSTTNTMAMVVMATAVIMVGVEIWSRQQALRGRVRT